MKTPDTKINVGTILRKKDTDRLYPVVKVYDNGDVDILGDGFLTEKVTKETLKTEYEVSNLCNEEKVNHPKHYCREGAMECIDEMIILFGKEAVMTFCKLNAWKYRYRAAEKNGEEDMKKSDWYIQLYNQLLNTFNYE